MATFAKFSAAGSNFFILILSLVYRDLVKLDFCGLVQKTFV